MCAYGSTVCSYLNAAMQWGWNLNVEGKSQLYRYNLEIYTMA